MKQRPPRQPRVALFDTTLRDGEQGEGVTFTLEDKLKIATLLDGIGIDYIEGGWPGSNPKAIEFFQRAKSLKLKRAKITAFGSTRRAGNKPEEDYNLKALIAAQTPAVTIFGKTWDFHVTHALRISLEENVELIRSSIQFLKKQKREVIYDAEHFFDGMKQNKKYALATLKAAAEAGADCIVLCDTNGGSLPHEIETLMREAQKAVQVPLGIHTHNDSELGVANAIVAVRQGAVHVQGTINGYGERCGNANLCSIIPILKLKMGIDCLSDPALAQLTELSRHVSELANRVPNTHQPFVGSSAFTHKGGIHVSAVMKEPGTYEHIDPALVGNQRRVTVSELSGVSNLFYKAKEYGFDLSKDTPEIKTLLAQIKRMENQGYQFEEGEASFELLLKKVLGKHRAFFTLEGFRITDERRSDGTFAVEATVRILVDGELIHTASDGNGPVSALDHAIRKALEQRYPRVRQVKLTDYRVRVLDGKDGTAANVRVIMESTDGEYTWGTVGVSSNIIEASWGALLDSIEYKLLLDASS